MGRSSIPSAPDLMPREVAREDGSDALALETAGEALRLGDPAGRERVVG
jgi:hypothetical protein